MADLETIRTITIQAKTDGVKEASDDLNKLADAQSSVAETSDSSAKSVLNASSSFDRLQKSIDPNYRASIQLAAAQKTLDLARNEGLVSVDRYNQLTDLATQKFSDAARGSSVFSNALGGVRNQMVALAAGAGPVGVFLAQFGPLGLAAAAGFGLAEKGIDLVIGAATQLGQKAQEMQAFSLVTGITTDEIQKLNMAGSQFGLTTDQTTRFIEQFSAKLTEARTASGSYFDMVRQINPALAQQILIAQGLDQQLLVLAQAYSQAGSKGNALLQAAGGRGAIANAPLVQSIGTAGGVGNLPGTPTIDASQITALATALAEINTQGDRVRDTIASMFASTVLANMAAARKETADFLTEFKNFSPSAALTRVMDWFSNEAGKFSFQQPGAGLLTPNIIPTPAYPPQLNTTGLEGPTPAQSPEAIANQYKATIAALGTAATAQEQYNVRVGELNVSLSKNVVTQDEYNRALNSAGLQLAIQLESQRNSLLGQAATVADLVTQKQDEINAARQKGIAISAAEASGILAATAAAKVLADQQILTTNNVAAAEGLRATKIAELNALIAQGKLTQDQATVSLQANEKIIEQTIEQQNVQKAALTGLMQLQQQSASLRNQLDTLGQGITNGLSQPLLDLETGATSAGTAFTNMGVNIEKAILSMINQMIIMAPIARALQTVLGGFLPSGSGLAAAMSGNAGSIPNLGAWSGIDFTKGFVGHTGGIIGSGELAGRFVHPTYFENAPRYHSGGLVSGEVPIIARTGEGVFTPEQMKAMWDPLESTCRHASLSIL